MRRRWPQMLTTVMVVTLAVLVLVLTGATVFLVVRSVNQSHKTDAAVRAFTQANVRARSDDCEQANQLRAALREQVRASQRTDPILFKLVPSLDTPAVHAIVRAQRARQLKAYAAKDCREYALEAVPPAQRSEYTDPRGG